MSTTSAIDNIRAFGKRASLVAETLLAGEDVESWIVAADFIRLDRF